MNNKTSANSAFTGYEELSRSRRVLSTSAFGPNFSTKIIALRHHIKIITCNKEIDPVTFFERCHLHFTVRHAYNWGKICCEQKLNRKLISKTCTYIYN